MQCRAFPNAKISCTYPSRSNLMKRRCVFFTTGRYSSRIKATAIDRWFGRLFVRSIKRRKTCPAPSTRACPLESPTSRSGCPLRLSSCRRDCGCLRVAGPRLYHLVAAAVDADAAAYGFDSDAVSDSESAVAPRFRQQPLLALMQRVRS